MVISCLHPLLRGRHHRHHLCCLTATTAATTATTSLPLPPAPLQAEHSILRFSVTLPEAGAAGVDSPAADPAGPAFAEGVAGKRRAVWDWLLVRS